MNSSFRVAITGLGIFSCLGSSLHEVKEALLQGKSGIGLDRNREKIGFRSSLTGILPKPNLKEMGLHRKELRTMDEPAQYAYIAAKMALENAGLSLKDIQNPRWGIVFGNDSTVKPTVEALDILRKDKETRFIGSGYIFRSMNSTVTMNLAVLLGIEGASWTLSSACASGAHAIGQGVMLIRSGLQDGVLVGGAQEVNIESMASFDALGAFSTRMDEPQKASRPFDAHRDGLVPSGGGACLVLENWEKAKKRGAPIYAAIEGYGFSTRSGKHLSEPNFQGAVQAMTMALKEASLSPQEINYINAHATSTPLGDLEEGKAIYEIFGKKVAVSSTKSMTGHECWMAGASEVIYTILGAQEGVAPPNINFESFSDDMPHIDIVSCPREMPIRWALSNSFGFGGTNASLLMHFEI